MGGDVQMVEISALYGKNVDALQVILFLDAPELYIFLGSSDFAS